MTRAQYAARPRRESLSKQIGAQIRVILARDGEGCIYCGRTAAESGAHLHLDHLTPRSCGGQNTPANLVRACRSCNCARQARSLAAWCGPAMAGLVRAHARTRRGRLAEILALRSLRSAA